jgi:hypothetical protein
VQQASTDPPERPLEERKLDYVRVERGSEARSPVAVSSRHPQCSHKLHPESLQINKSISELLARNRARNDASNRAEFLHTHRRHHTGEASEVLRPGEGDEAETASCARADARTVDRDVMMKFDIAKNEEGPLRRTLKVEMKDEEYRPTDKTIEGDHPVTANRHPGLDERLKNLETHLAMRYGKFACSVVMFNLTHMRKYHHLRHHSFIALSLLKIILFNSSANTLLGPPCITINLVGV